MKWFEQNEFSGIVQRIGPALLQTSPSGWGTDTAAALRRSVGALLGSTDANSSLKAFTPLFIDCTAAARANGATYQTMGRVRAAAMKEAPQYQPGIDLVQKIIRLSLASEARLVAMIDFSSREDVQKVTDDMSAAFYAAAEAASDAMDASTYMAVTSLNAAVTKYLADRVRTLPRMVRYRFHKTMTALHMSQTLYGTGARADELIRENKVVHPAFMPRDIRALTE